MVSFMHLFKSKNNNQKLFAALLCLLISAFSPTQSHANGFNIVSAKTHLVKNVYQLEANIDLKFSDDA